MNVQPLSMSGLLDGMDFLFLVDTSASRSLANDYLVSNTCSLPETTLQVTAANGSQVATRGRANLKVAMQGLGVTHLVLVRYKLQRNAILEMDFLTKHRDVITPSNWRLRFMAPYARSEPKEDRAATRKFSEVQNKNSPQTVSTEKALAKLKQDH